MPLAAGLREFIELLNSHRVDYLIVGAHALAFHGRPRYTGDLDVLVGVSEENSHRLEQALHAFGFASRQRDKAWRRRVAAELDGLPVFFVDRESLIKNKRATARPQDLADVDALGEDG